MHTLLPLLLSLSISPADSRIDCVRDRCPEILIAGDGADARGGRPTPFSGFADATIRKDPDTGRLWMAYSWPHVRSDEGGGRRGARRLAARPVPAVAIHLASSEDDGKTWRFEGELWGPAAASGPNGEPGHHSYEVANLLPRRTARGTVWYAARIAYFLPEGRGFAARSPGSFRLEIMTASSPRALKEVPVGTLGAAATDRHWSAEVNLASLSPDVRHCSIWNEPALYFDGKELFLALSCMAFRGRVPDMARNDLVVFATRPDGVPRAWRWRYVGRLSGAAEARELGAERLTQIDLATGRDGRLLAIVTPDTWDTSLDDFVHHGCRILEVASLDPPRLAQDEQGRLRVRTHIEASDAGAEGTAACTYDPASDTGVILGKRSKRGAGMGGATGRGASMTASLHRTRLHP